MSSAFPPTPRRPTIDDLERTLPWFRVVFGAIGLFFPRLLGRWYGLLADESESAEVAVRYACIRAIGLGFGQLIAPKGQRRAWNRVALAVDALDTAMVLHAGLRGKVPRRKAATMLCGTVFGVVVGLLARARDESEEV
ncbi:hypothetical protein [Natronobacterium texcoconense]|uniref:Uncharacterized protein n=1 Tax=Natronobacterium texcoconense TaxID=1095778 RepID=A0A1H0ZIM8_NATTX|nr:hypothetical protein [Natronobacterium texcoconense]SDQ27318.1 hypothetical protein SAMN04489842_0306 [Natronobacterium texcoconense]